MNKSFEKIILKITKSKELYKIEEIQEIWDGYGNVIRYGLKYSKFESVVAKNICFQKKRKSTKAENEGFKAKVKSYKVEEEFYKIWSEKCSIHCKVPNWYAFEWQNDEVIMVLEDLDGLGFNQRRTFGTWSEMVLGLKWLANFHAVFMNEKPKKIWTRGSYWNIENRTVELEKMKDIDLKNAAKAIEKRLNNCTFKTFVHGDAKIQNFCFSEDNNSVAALDFQYVGAGCGMKDIAYFIDSCISPEEAESWESEILDIYFSELRNGLERIEKIVDFKSLEDEWRKMYQFAWADFYRFIKGWAPGRYENDYSEKVARNVIDSLKY